MLSSRHPKRDEVRPAKLRGPPIAHVYMGKGKSVKMTKFSKGASDKNRLTFERVWLCAHLKQSGVAQYEIGTYFH